MATRVLFWSVVLAAAAVGGARRLAAQDLEIGIIDFYGQSRVSASEMRAALPFKEGDKLTRGTGGPSPVLAEAEVLLARQPEVARARVKMICCEDGRAIVYVGIEDASVPILRFRDAPSGPDRLPAEIVREGEAFEEALTAAVLAGEAFEDNSRGHSLAENKALRAIQERFAAYARRDPAALRRVLRDSSDAVHRALAAQVLGYAADKQGVVDDLVFATIDPDEGVRNDAARALAVFAQMVPGAGQTVPRVPLEPFIKLLSSPVWSDRNKASLGLAALSQGWEPGSPPVFHREALTSLAEMARWKSAGHALSAFLVLVRIGGSTDEIAQAAWERRDPEAVIAAAMSRSSTAPVKKP